METSHARQYFDRPSWHEKGEPCRIIDCGQCAQAPNGRFPDKTELAQMSLVVDCSGLKRAETPVLVDLSNHDSLQ